MKKLVQIGRLGQLTSVVHQSAQSRLAREVAQEMELRHALERLSGSFRNVERGPDVAFRAGADVAWRTWVEQRRTLINAELAKCLVRQAKARNAAALAFGRNQAVSELDARERAQIKLVADRRKLNILANDIDDQHIFGDTRDDGFGQSG